MSGVGVRSPRQIAVVCGLLSAAVGLLVAYLSQGDSINPKAMINLAYTDPLAKYVRASEPHFPLVTPAQHYDGVYYYAIARDPFLLGRAHTLIDQAPYRYGHPLHGWLAAILSGGDAGAIPAALFALSLIGLGAAGWLASRLADDLGGRPWLGLLVAGSPGLLYAVTVSTTETVGAALVLGALLCWQRDRFGLAAIVMVLACLDKEQYVAVPVGLALWELTRELTREHPRDPTRHAHRPAGASLTRRLALLVVTPVPLAAWYVYVHSRLHTWPFDYQPGNLGAPLQGWIVTFRDARSLTLGSFDESEIGSVVVPLLIALAVVLVAAAARAAWFHSNPLHLPLVVLVVITSCQGWRTLLYPHELVRTPAIVLLLALLVLLIPASRNRPQISDS